MSNEDVSFNIWMDQVDAKLIDLTGLSSRELPDTHYYDMFDDGQSPEEAAEQTAWDYIAPW